MAVFQAAGDESDGERQRGAFVYGGYVARTLEWIESFAPAWEERVLNANPTIPYLHMVDMRSPKWRAKHGITYDQAERRIDEASFVLGSSGFLHPVRTILDGGVFRDVFGETRVVRPGTQPGTYPFEPDYIGFLGFAYAALEYVGTNHSDAEQVDFIVERKSGVTHHINDFVDHLAEGLKRKGQKHLTHLIGEVIPGGKERVPLQAADVAVWHLRRHEIGNVDPVDEHRLYRMFNRRPMTVNGMNQETIEAMGIRSKQNNVQSPFKVKTKHTLRSGDGAA